MERYLQKKKMSTLEEKYKESDFRDEEHKKNREHSTSQHTGGYQVNKLMAMSKYFCM